MRTATYVWVLAALGCAGSGLLASCSSITQCSEGICGEATGGGGSAGGSGSSMGGGGGGIPAGCDPTKGDVVASNCGIFVSSSKGGGSNDGSKEKPVKTLEQALAIADGKPIYACAEGFNESITAPSGTTLFGGLDCKKDWAWRSGAITTLNGLANEVALVLEGDADVFDFRILASSATTKGASSIALLARVGEISLERCELEAQAGAGGEDGEDAPSTAPPTPEKGDEQDGQDACSQTPKTKAAPGGAQLVNDCGDGDVSIGGKGGDGNQANGGDGSNGGPAGAKGAGGKGELAGGWDCSVGAPNGGADTGASTGPADPGLAGTGLGTLSSTGHTGVDGGNGKKGRPGQGGGGGGGAKGGANICSGGTPGSGASGGSGGAGGCGGLGGKGGRAGGASIALASLGANVTLRDSRLKAGPGGSGGMGGDAQAGGSGGDPGSGGASSGAVGSQDACDGGKGGRGGDGGPGGGGLGGPSLGIAFIGMAPTRLGKTTVEAGTPGSGGDGGNFNAQANQGANGPTGEEQDFGL